MNWNVRLSNTAIKQLNKLNHSIQERILDYLDQRIEGCKNPRHFGEPLKGNKSGLWRYRVGDYRIICTIVEEELIVLALTIGHRKEVYTL